MNVTCRTCGATARAGKDALAVGFVRCPRCGDAIETLATDGAGAGGGGMAGGAAVGTDDGLGGARGLKGADAASGAGGVRAGDGDGPRTALPGMAPTTPPPPPHGGEETHRVGATTFTVRRDREAVEVTWRWSARTSLIGLSFSALGAFVLVAVFGTLVVLGRMPLPVLPILLPFGVMDVLAVVGILLTAQNSTTVRRDDRMLSVRRHPVPFPPTLGVDVMRIIAVERKEAGDVDREPRYAAYVLTDDGGRFPLLRWARSEEIDFLVRELGLPATSTLDKGSVEPNHLDEIDEIDAIDAAE